MPHQCVHCGKLYPDACPELLAGCTCGSKFFFYIKKEKYDEIKAGIRNEIFPVIELKTEEKNRMEKDVREIIGLKEEEPVILDFESIRVLGPGKFQIDIVNLFSKNRPIIYRLEEGKYIIDLASTLKVSKEELDRKIKDPNKKK